MEHQGPTAISHVREAVLIGPEADANTILDESEYETLASALRLERAADDPAAQAIAHALRGMNRRQLPADDTLRALLDGVMQRLGAHAEDVQGIVAELLEPPILLREAEHGEDRLKCLKALLVIFESGGWLADFLEIALPRWAEKRPKPLDVMWRLSEEAQTLQADIDHAKRLMREWPEMFAAEKSEGAHA